MHSTAGAEERGKAERSPDIKSSPKANRTLHQRSKPTKISL